LTKAFFIGAGLPSMVTANEGVSPGAASGNFVTAGEDVLSRQATSSRRGSRRTDVRTARTIARR
jgi:hypothetical protein